MSKPLFNLTLKDCSRTALGAAAALALLGVTAARSFADPPVAMAPPDQPGIAQDAAPADAGADSVFQWTEVPANQRIPLTRAVFDRNGYQLYDTVGETVVVPFTDDNLYVMKFAPSDDGTLYLVNTGDAPVLYVPEGGYLENASVPGARWYPFSDGFRPAQPVFLGVAPSWDAFVSIGWARDVVIRGGYWGRRSFLAGGVFLPSVGLVFEVGGHPYHGWEPYHDYVIAHPDHFRVWHDDHVYHGRAFRGAGGPGYAHGGAWAGGGGHDYRDDHRAGSPYGHRVFRGARGDYHRDRH